MLCHTAYLNTPPARLEISRLSQLSKTVSKAQWRALLARDGECVVRGCHRRASQRLTNQTVTPAGWLENPTDNPLTG